MIEAEAREKAAAIIAEAEAQAAAIAAESEILCAAEAQRLADAKRASAKFIEGMNMICEKQMAFLKKIEATEYVKQVKAPVVEAAPVEEPAPAQEPTPAEMHETVKSIEETVSKVAAVPEQTIVPDIAAPQAAIHTEAPTRAFNRVSEEVQFSFDSFDDLD